MTTLARIARTGFAALCLAACGQPASAPAGTDSEAAKAEPAAAAFDQAAAEAELLAWARAQHGADLIEPIDTFFGDFSGDGAPDALALAYYATGGSGAGLHPAIFRNEAGRMAYVRDVEIYGTEPRDAAFAPGRITITTLMPGPDDPHCCPTQPQQWTIETN